MRMNSRLALVFGIIVVVMASAAASLIPIQVKAQGDLGVYPGFPPNPNGEICGQAGKEVPIQFC